MRYMIVAFVGDKMFNESEYRVKRIAQLLCWLKNRRFRKQTSILEPYTWFEVLDKRKYPA
jgi:hypothetical protein